MKSAQFVNELSLARFVSRRTRAKVWLFNHSFKLNTNLIVFYVQFCNPRDLDQSLNGLLYLLKLSQYLTSFYMRMFDPKDLNHSLVGSSKLSQNYYLKLSYFRFRAGLRSVLELFTS